MIVIWGLHMRAWKYLLAGFACVFLLCGAVFGADVWDFEVVSESYTLGESFTVSVEVQHDEVSAGGESALALNFEAFGKWHFYSDNSLVPNGKLTLAAEGEGLVFGDPVFPASHLFADEILEKSYEVYEGKFTVFVPFTVDSGGADGKIPVTVQIGGAICAEMCIRLKEEAKVSTDVTVKASASMAEPGFTVSEVIEEVEKEPVLAGRERGFLSVPAALGLAILAGLLLNVMPCVWPIIPIVVTRLWNIAGESRKKCAGMGVAFCVGILLFFAVLAGANIVLRIGYGEFFQWGDHLRNPAIVTAMSLLMMVLGLFMFGVFSFTLPSSVSNKAGGGSGVVGIVIMGFLLALLSTPCSFAILGAVFLWAQTQEIVLATLTIMLIGVGMAIPYLVLTTVEGLLGKLPRSGAWMERVKQAMGFLLLLIGVKLFSAIPAEARVDTLYYAVILAFCVWMWGGWVTYSTSRGRKWLIRLIAVAIAVGCGWFFLGASTEKPIDWQDYDRVKISAAVEEGRPVVIKFTADWCTNCSVVERFVYMREDVGELFKRKGVAAFIGDTTTGDEVATKDLAAKYFELGGVPVTVILLPDGEQVHLRGIIGKGDVVEVLEKIDDVKGIDGEKEDQGR
ncbi:MAG: DUF255 domain-containing protein [Planctomycetes bacterium]|nr:DUF255 domain-containing protein [Planctomycetota bacterium]